MGLILVGLKIHPDNSIKSFGYNANYVGLIYKGLAPLMLLFVIWSLLFH